MSDEGEPTDLALVPVQPLVSPKEAAMAWRVFMELKKRLLDDGDYVLIKGVRMIRKSGFRKFSLVFNLSDEIIEQEKTVREDETFYWRVVTRVTAPNGRTSVGVGICDSKERKFAHVEHDVYSTAHTRAKNRAISDMVAGGVVSAEEMSSTPQEETSKSDSTSIFDTVILKKKWNWNKIFEEFGPEIEKRHKELGEKKFTFEFAAVVVAREKGCVKKNSLDQEVPI